MIRYLIPATILLMLANPLQAQVRGPAGSTPPPSSGQDAAQDQAAGQSDGEQSSQAPQQGRSNQQRRNGQQQGRADAQEAQPNAGAQDRVAEQVVIDDLRNQLQQLQQQTQQLMQQIERAQQAIAGQDASPNAAGANPYHFYGGPPPQFVEQIRNQQQDAFLRQLQTSYPGFGDPEASVRQMEEQQHVNALQSRLRHLVQLYRSAPEGEARTSLEQQIRQNAEELQQATTELREKRIHELREQLNQLESNEPQLNVDQLLEDLKARMQNGSSAPAQAQPPEDSESSENQESQNFDQESESAAEESSSQPEQP